MIQTLPTVTKIVTILKHRFNGIRRERDKGTRYNAKNVWG
jgi:hypothetical protein